MPPSVVRRLRSRSVVRASGPNAVTVIRNRDLRSASRKRSIRRFNARSESRVPAPRCGPRPARLLHRVVKVVASTFRGVDRPGDFSWEVRASPETARTRIYLYLDNATQSNDEADLFAGADGPLRPYRATCAHGIPTGANFSGFADLLTPVTFPRSYRGQLAPFGSSTAASLATATATPKDLIDRAIDRLVLRVETSPDVCEIVYTAASEDDDRVGHGAFAAADHVRDYVTDKLRSLPSVLLERARARRAMQRA